MRKNSKIYYEKITTSQIAGVYSSLVKKLHKQNFGISKFKKMLKC
jgi:hypothetical protein